MRAERELFGTRVLGPILAEFAMRLTMFARALPQNSQILFCARGGLRLRLVFERFLSQIGQPSPVPHDDLMISRLAVARGALLARASAASDEIAREFADATMSGALAALSQTQCDAAGEWRRPFEIGGFLRLFWSDDRTAVEARTAIAAQAELFDAHFLARRRREHVVLCDTGLYGSTLRLLSASRPDAPLSCVMFARANYKGFDAGHFRRAAGLIVERDAYSPLDVRSAALRYWQFIEHVCEPPLESVKSFTRDADGTPRSNLERPGWRKAVAQDESGFFAGALAYLSELTPETYGERLGRDIPRAWKEFRRRVLRPSAADAALLAVDGRGRDFGRTETVESRSRGGFSLSNLRASLWREGEASQAPLGLGGLLQAGLEAAQIARQVRRELKPKLARLAR